MSFISNYSSKQKIAIATLSIFMTILFVLISAYIVQIIKNKDASSPALPKLIGTLIALSIVCIAYLIICSYFQSKQYAELEKKVDEIDSTTKGTLSDLTNLREENIKDHKGIKDGVQKLHTANNEVKVDISNLNGCIETGQKEQEKALQSVKSDTEQIKGNLDSTRADLTGKIADLAAKIADTKKSVNGHTDQQTSALKAEIEALRTQLKEEMDTNTEKTMSHHDNSINGLLSQLKALEESNITSNKDLKDYIHQMLLPLQTFLTLLSTQSLPDQKMENIKNVSHVGTDTVINLGTQ